MMPARGKTQNGLDRFTTYLKRVISVHPQLVDLCRRLPNRTLFETVREIGRRLDRQEPIIYPDVWANRTQREIGRDEWSDLVYLLRQWCQDDGDPDQESLSATEARQLALSLMWTTMVLDEFALRIKKEKGFPSEFPE